MENQCGSCKYFEQGKSCSFCCNPNQDNESCKSYCYWNDRCNLYEKGIHKTRIDLLKSE